jgi:hypothetical protein
MLLLVIALGVLLLLVAAVIVTTCQTVSMYRPAEAAAASGSLPSWRATMYAAYQSHQSCGGVTASKAPWRSEVSWSRSARAWTSIGQRPGRRVLSSWSRQLLPSGSLNETQEL